MLVYITPLCICRRIYPTRTAHTLQCCEWHRFRYGTTVDMAIWHSRRRHVSRAEPAWTTYQTRKIIAIPSGPAIPPILCSSIRPDFDPEITVPRNTWASARPSRADQAHMPANYPQLSTNTIPTIDIPPRRTPGRKGFRSARKVAIWRYSHLYTRPRVDAQ